MRGLVRTTAILWVLLLLPAATATAELYRSNAVGIRGEPLGPDEINEPEGPEYILDVSTESGKQIERLLHNGEETQRVEIVRDGSSVTEETYRDNKLDNRIVRRGGNLVREERYSDGELTERWEFRYEESRLTSREAYGPDGTVLYREGYSYWRDGTLRSIVKQNDARVRTEYRYRKGQLEEEWVSRPGEAERFEFDAAGRMIIRELYREEELVEQEVRLYWAGDSSALLKQVVVSAGERTTSRGYDEKGRLATETVEEAGKTISELRRIFEGDLLVSEIRTDANGERRWDYGYDEAGEQVTESYREDGNLVEVTHLSVGSEYAPADRMTELYHRGSVVLRIYYAGQNRLREEVVRDGEVIRTRDFSPDSGDQAE